MTSTRKIKPRRIRFKTPKPAVYKIQRAGVTATTVIEGFVTAKLASSHRVTFRFFNKFNKKTESRCVNEERIEYITNE